MRNSCRTQILVVLSLFLAGASCEKHDPSATESVSRAFIQEPPVQGLNLMAALGDSITAGTFADTAATDPDPTSAIAGFIDSRFQDGLFAQYLNEHKELSWATGNGVSQLTLLRRSIREINPTADVEALNAAVPGVGTDHLAEQVQAVVEAMGTGRYRSLLYVTLLIGSNEGCGHVDPAAATDEAMSLALDGAFAKLASIHQDRKIRVLMVGLPNIPQLGEPDVADQSLFPLLSCSQLQLHFLHFCDPLLGWSDAQSYQIALNTILRKNQVLVDSASRAMKAHPELDIHFTRALTERKIRFEELAMDCFHPNQGAHEEIARALWSEQPWFF